MKITLSIPRADLKSCKLCDVPKTVIGAKPKKPNMAPLAAVIRKMKNV